MPTRREVHRLAAVLASLVPVSGLFAASPAVRPGAVPAAVPAPISDALCGRGTGPRTKLASALDEYDRGVLPPSWREVEVDGLQRWLAAPVCSGASESEANLYRSRHSALEQLGRRMERARVTEQMGAALARFRGWRSSSPEWPSSLECEGCAALRSSAAQVADITSRWPPQMGTQLGARLGDAARWEPLVAELCAAKPSPGARDEIQRRFRYYTWTASAASLFEVAAFFERADVVAVCRDR